MNTVRLNHAMYGNANSAFKMTHVPPRFPGGSAPDKIGSYFLYGRAVRGVVTPRSTGGVTAVLQWPCHKCVVTPIVETWRGVSTL